MTVPLAPTASLRSVCRIQYASDLHLEFQEKAVFPQLVKPVARLLVLAGDIGNPEHNLYRAFLEWCHDKWDHIFVIAGNHEFYNKRLYTAWRSGRPTSWGKRLDMCREVCSTWPNVHFLEKKSVYLPEYNVAVLGTTLWSDIPEDMWSAAREGMNDYNFISNEFAYPITPLHTVSAFKENVAWLNAEIHNYEEQRTHCVVVTHHLPTYKLCSPQFDGHPLNCCFMSSLDDMIRHPVRAWICGHSHTQKELRIQRDDPPTEFGETICGLNAHGYNVLERYHYSSEKVLEFPCGPWPRESLLITDYE